VLKRLWRFLKTPATRRKGDSDVQRSDPRRLPGGDAEFKHTQHGKSVCNFSLATSETWNDRAGKKQERTEWHRVNYWNPPEKLVQYLTKGTLLLVKGSIRTEKWQDKETGKDRYTTKIEARALKLLGGGKGRQEAGYGGEEGGGMSADSNTAFNGGDDDIPF
jgi:single-strand DNA-binding protein